MADEDLMNTVMRLNGAVETLAAIGALLRVELDGIAVPDELEARLRAIAIGAGADPSRAPVEVRRAAAGAIRTFFHQSLDLLAHPDREFGWHYDDPIVLQSQGRVSMIIPDVMPMVATQLEGLSAALGRQGAAMLDVGTGVGWLAIGAARRFATMRIVGLDIWEPSLALARSNVAAEGLVDRIELRKQDVLALDDRDAYDVAWMPGPFLPRDVAIAAMPRIRDALKPGAWVLFGLWGGPDGLASDLAALRTIRSGGHPWSAEDAIAELGRNGFADAHEVDRTWGAPVRFVVACRPA